MKQLLLVTALLFTGALSFGQNINDHKISFNYIQLPLLKIDTQFDQYSVKIEHAYRQANEDSTMFFEARRNLAMETFQTAVARYYSACDSLDRLHLQKMATWEKQLNSGTTNAGGTAPTQPIAQPYPQAPIMDQIEAPLRHSEFEESTGINRINLAGYGRGEGEIEVTMIIHPIRTYRIESTKKGTGANTKYEYKARYVMPIGLRVANPAQGIMMETLLFENEMTFNLATQTSKYDHQLYMMDNKEVFFRQLETHARQNALARANDHLNNHFGFVERSRTAEIYSVKAYKGFDYSDVTNAFTQSTLALNKIGADRNRSGAMTQINSAIEATEAVLTESNLSDKKSRINDKITAMLQCNLAELYMWKADFNKSDGLANLAENSGEGKAKRHIRDEMNFYKDQRNRWDVHY